MIAYSDPERQLKHLLGIRLWNKYSIFLDSLEVSFSVSSFTSKVRFLVTLKYEKSMIGGSKYFNADFNRLQQMDTERFDDFVEITAARAWHSFLIDQVNRIWNGA